jgi:hypothetical protein
MTLVVRMLNRLANASRAPKCAQEDNNLRIWRTIG